ncbi:MAG: hypothetical protein DI537_37910 [Stutzerimonas stutzeri]|nr:MAG: hypothetical protein DI537_37910 [Stutzerimonas stutzeri]
MTNDPNTAEIKAWHRNKLKIDLDVVYPQGIVTMTRAGTMYRVSWKCDDATYKIGTDRKLWYGYDSFQDEVAAERALMGVVDCMERHGLTPEIVR